MEIVIAITRTASATRTNQWLPIDSPRIAIHKRQGKTQTESKHNNTPPTFDPIAFSKSPFIVYAHEVVIPQPGHRIPTIVYRLQPGSPSWVWVPIPDAFGFSQAAIVRRVKRKNPRQKKTIRSVGLYCAPCWLVWIIWVAEFFIGATTSFKKLLLQTYIDVSLDFRNR